MGLMWNRKDGGPESHVFMYGFESKRFGSVLLLRFEPGSREAFHSHAFSAVSWLLRGYLLERMLDGELIAHRPGAQPIRTLRETFHKVTSWGRSWVLTLRSPWAQVWREYLPETDTHLELTHGRKLWA